MQKRFVSIWFPYLTTDWHVRKQPALRHVPFVLKATVHHRSVVTAANQLARAQGIQKHMVLADAKALCPSLQVLDDKPTLAAQLTSRLAEWCIRFTPVAASDSPDGVLLDATGCTHLWGGEEAYLTDLTTRLQQRGYTVRAAMADTVGCAWAAAGYGSAGVVESGKQLDALLPLPVASLRLEGELVGILHKLGLRQVNDIVGLSSTSLRRRFGTIIPQRLQQALGKEEESILPVYPVSPYQERLPCIEPIKTKEGIEIALQQLLANLCLRLRTEGKGLRAAYFRTYRCDGGTSGSEITTNQPTQNSQHLFALFSLKISTIEPKEGIELFLLEATKVEEQAVRQEALWQGQTVADNTAVFDLMDRFVARLGQSSIRRFLPTEHYWPERSYKASFHLSEAPETGWKLDRPRPVQVLTPPQVVEVTAPVPDYPPMSFRHKGVLHKIKRADGPERIEQEWWLQEGEHRDYYAVEDEEGRRYWLFRSGHYNEMTSPKWYLHGYFA